LEYSAQCPYGGRGRPKEEKLEEGGDANVLPLLAQKWEGGRISQGVGRKKRGKKKKKGWGEGKKKKTIFRTIGCEIPPLVGIDITPSLKGASTEGSKERIRKKIKGWHRKIRSQGLRRFTGIEDLSVSSLGRGFCGVLESKMRKKNKGSEKRGKRITITQTIAIETTYPID